MKNNLLTLSIYLLYFQTCLSVTQSEKIIAKVGGSINLPCNEETRGDIQWKKNGQRVGKTKDHYKNTNSNRFHLELNNIQLSDSGTFDCVKGNQNQNPIRTVTLIVVQASAFPSSTLIVSENLKLVVSSSPEIALQVSWWKDGKNIGPGTHLEKNNVQIEDSGTYKCQVKLEGRTEDFSIEIKVKGFEPSETIVYISRKKTITIPIFFNFKVRDTPLFSDVSTEEGNLTYSSRIIKKLTVMAGAACWPEKCNTKVPPGESNDLSANVSKPPIGYYRMEIVLKVDGRKKMLWRDVCVANLTVSASPSYISMESNVTLRCNVTCIDAGGKLCWYHPKLGPEFCGQAGQNSLAKVVTALPETVGNWTCSVVVGTQRKASENHLLEVVPDFLDLSNYLFWVTVGAGVLVLLLIVVIITIMIARRRRVRRARFRAWLIENLHEQRRCECNGFAPKRLKENI
ncbi:obscurin-like protein 1 isoform X2 [Mixophyes fleayi]